MVDPSPITQAVSAAQPWEIGTLCAVVLALTGVITYLFKLGRRDQRALARREIAWAEERAAWAVERETLRADYEERHRQLVIDQMTALREERDASRAREDTIRHEQAELMEGITEQSVKAADALTKMLQKFYDRLLGSRPRGKEPYG